jgi:putative PEP-CTERM system TPR-repeat lipoprotein
MAANYDVLNAPKNVLEGISSESDNNGAKTAPTNSGSVLDSLQKTQIDVRKEGYQNVIELLKQGKVAEAQAKNNALIKEYPREAEFYNLQATLDMQNKNVEAAKKSYETALTLNPNSPLARMGIARITMEQGQLDIAKDHLEKLLAVNDKVVAAYVLLADIASKQKKDADIEKYLLKGYEQAKGAVDVELEMLGYVARFYNAQKKIEKILPIAEEIAKRYPNNSNAINFLAQAQIANNKKAEAYTTLHKFVTDNTQDINNRLFLAKLLMERTDKEQEILQLLDESAKIDSSKVDAQILKAAYLIKLKRNEEAMTFIDKVITQFPKVAQARMLKAELYLADKKFDEALAVYQQAYKESPDNGNVLFALVDVLSHQGKASEAIKLLNDIVEKNPKNLAVRFRLAMLYQQQHDDKQAESQYKAVLDAQPDNVLALNNLAFIYGQQNNPKAIELAKKAYEKAPDAPAVVDTYGSILVKQGDAKEGLALLEKAVKLAPKAGELQFHLADAYAATGDVKKAIAVLETLTQGKDDFPEKQAAIDLLTKLKAQ